MVKDGKHRTRAISCNHSEAGDDEIVLSGNRSAFSLVSNIQEEVHRFAIKYHRESRSKGVKHLSLTEIPGIGPARAKALLSHFKTISAIKSAEADDLIKAPGMTQTAAQAVWAYYHG